MKKSISTAYTVVPENLSAFKNPFGELIKGSPTETMTKLAQIVKKQKPPRIISIGDTVSHNLHKHGMIPRLAITDNLAMRKKVEPQSFEGKRLIRVKNPQGKITQQAIDAIREAMQAGEHVHILVDGEEDLLTLIAVLYAPENALVVYGQPNEGVVAVKVTPRKKAEAEIIWKKMKTTKEQDSG